VTTQSIQRRDPNAADRVTLALKLRLQKKTYDEIAKAAGYADRASAYNAVKREMDRRIVSGVDELRREESLILDALHNAVMPLVTADKCNLFAVDRVLAIMDRRARLLGLDIKPEDQVTSSNYTKTIVLQHAPSVNQIGAINASSNDKE